MTTFERRQQLVEILRQQPGLRVPQIAQALGVSQGTIRNDLNALEESGQLTRVRGGASLQEDTAFRNPSFATRARRNSANKRIIAHWAADLVEDGDSILLDASTTVYYMALELQNRQNLRVVTNGIEVARTLAKNPTNTVILLGGVLNLEGATITGPIAEKIVEDLHIQTAFVSCSGFTPDVGLTEIHLYEAQLKSKAMRSVDRIIALVDSTKFGKADLTAFAHLDQISQLFTDQDLDQGWINRLQSTCLNFSVCGERDVARYSPCGKNSRHFRIGFANLSEQIPFAVDVRHSLEQAAKAAGNVDLVLADNQLDPNLALEIAGEMLSQNLDLVIEFQIDEKIGNRIMRQFQNAGIPVIAVDIPMIGATFFGVDNYRAGFLAGTALGQWVLDHWDGQIDRLLVLDEPRAGTLPASRLQGQMEGLQSKVGEIAGSKIIRFNSGNTREISSNASEQAITQLPNLHRLAILSFNDDAAMGAQDAAKKMNRLNDVAIIGQGADRVLRKELRNPGTRIIGSTASYPERYGEKLIQVAIKILQGEPVQPAVYTDHIFINSRNIELYYPE
jgi:ribose transport system substrate-binding protein